MPIAPAFPLEKYWNEFEITDQDLEFIYNLLLDREVPLTVEEMADALVEHRLEALHVKIEEAEKQALAIYRPEENYEVGQKMIFQAIGGKLGEVIGVRTGENPALGEFDVIQVSFEEDGDSREFAARLKEVLPMMNS